MSILFAAKKSLSSLPYPLGRAVALWPYAYRPGGRIYAARAREIHAWDSWDRDQRKAFIVDRVKAIATHAFNHVPFYADLYLSHGLDPQKLRHFEEIESLPVVTRSMLQDVPLEERSSKASARMLANTGGTSGRPLHLFVGPDSIPNEWAHMHRIWSQVGFRSRDLKVGFTGAASVGQPARYDSLRHSIGVNIFAGWAVVADALLALPMLDKVRYLHGYPSALFDFILWLEAEKHPLLAVLRKTVRGLLLGSEYPAPATRGKAEALLGCGSVSWYGQTERTVLAGECGEKYRYVPFQTYGYTEAISPDDWEGYLLTSTSYFNRVSPFIRYVTGDRVEPVTDKGLMTEFRVTEGRNGDFVETVDGRKIFLTGMIFGRHQKIFNASRFIQVEQDAPGHARIHVVPTGKLTVEEAAELFEAGDVDLKFEFVVRDQPERTPAGKVPLLIKKVIA